MAHYLSTADFVEIVDNGESNWIDLDSWLTLVEIEHIVAVADIVIVVVVAADCDY